MNKVYRILLFCLSILVPVIFGWWLFIPAAILGVYLIKLPYEIILAGVLLDSVYYFGDSFLARFKLTLFAFIIILIALFLSEKIDWHKRI